MLRRHWATPLSYVSTVSAVDICVEGEKAFELATCWQLSVLSQGKSSVVKRLLSSSHHLWYPSLPECTVTISHGVCSSPWSQLIGAQMLTLVQFWCWTSYTYWISMMAHWTQAKHVHLRAKVPNAHQRLSAEFVSVNKSRIWRKLCSLPTTAVMAACPHPFTNLL